MASPHFPEPPSPIPPTSLTEIDARLASLAERKQAWVETSVSERIALLRACMETTLAVAPEWVAAACQAKGLDVNSHTSGEEWLAGPYTVLRNLRLFAEALEANGRPALPKVWTRPDGQMVAQVFPSNTTDKLLFTGFSAEVWLQPGTDASQGKRYRDKAHGVASEPKIALVLGAGNVASIGPMDALYKLVVDDEVVILKTNPVNAYLGPYYERAFQPLIDKGFYTVVHGGAEQGAHLTNHPLVDSIHITGSDATHDIIVFGADPDERARRKAANDPLNTRPITSELGCVTPCMIIPGDWSEADLDYHALNVASMVTNNASFNCNACKVVVTAEGWPQRERFLEKLHAALAAVPPKKAYYPGARQRYAAFLEHYGNAVQLQPDGDAHVPWTILPNVPAAEGEYALTNEAFCGVLAEVTLPATTPAEFMERALTFANEECWGTLSCMTIIDPKTQRANAAAFDAFIAGLEYGGIAINAWAGMIYALVVLPWGAYPGHTLDDIRSGIGVVHNAYLLDTPQKSVLRAPFRVKPKPAYFATHTNTHKLGPALMRFEMAPSIFKVPSVAAAAFKG